MNLLKKTTPWMAASVLAVASLFGQTSKCDKKYDCMTKDADKRSFEQGQDVLKAQTMASYNAPAGIQVRGSWDLFVTGSFIYWQPTQDNMEYGLINNLYLGNVSGATGTTAATAYGLTGNWLEMKFKFQPGFKVGLGVNSDYDNWDFFAEYTYLRDRTTNSSNSSATSNILPTRGVAYTTAGVATANVYNVASQTWNCNFDFLNLEMGRACYVGRAFTVRPSVGVRGTLMRQKLRSYYNNNSIAVTAGGASATVPGSSGVEDYVHSWSVGPRLALNTNWLMGARFRLYGNFAGDITFTQYTMKVNQKFTPTASGTTRLATAENKLGVLRDHVEGELGFGWGTYFDNDNWYFDISAGYTWQVFYDQNMFREFGATNLAKGTYQGGNLYVNGMTANVRFDF